MHEKRNKDERSMAMNTVHHSGQCRLIGLLATVGQYCCCLNALMLTVNSTLSWEPIEFHSAVSEDDCIGYLAMHGVTEDEADDCLHFVYSWLKAVAATDEDAPHCIFIQGTLQAMRECPKVSPWLDNMPHIYDCTYARWVPVPPLQGSIHILPTQPYPSGTPKHRIPLPHVRLTQPDSQSSTMVIVPPLTAVAGPTDIVSSSISHLPLEEMTLDEPPSSNPTAMDLKEDNGVS